MVMGYGSKLVLKNGRLRSNSSKNIWAFHQWNFPKIILFTGIFPHKPTSYWGCPIYGNPPFKLIQKHIFLEICVDPSPCRLAGSQRATTADADFGTVAVASPEKSRTAPPVNAGNQAIENDSKWKMNGWWMVNGWLMVVVCDSWCLKPVKHQHFPVSVYNLLEDRTSLQNLCQIGCSATLALNPNSRVHQTRSISWISMRFTNCWTEDYHILPLTRTLSKNGIHIHIYIYM